MKKAAKIIISLVAAVLLIFLLGRYGWKIRGFGACHDAGISSVEVSEKAVHITGFYLSQIRLPLLQVVSKTNSSQ